MSTNWRDYLAIHPACAAYPELSHDELIALGNAIKTNGLQSPIVVLRNKSRYCRSYEYQLLDGRSRLDAMAAVGIEFNFVRGTRTSSHLHILNMDFKGNSTVKVTTVENMSDAEIEDFVTSANLHRRHLTAEQRRELIEKLLKATPEKSDRAIGKMAKADNKTVAKARAKLERREEIPHVAKRADSKGRKQPARKKKPKPSAAPVPTDDIKPSVAVAKLDVSQFTPSEPVDLKKIVELAGQARALLQHPTAANVESVKALLTKITRLCTKPVTRTSEEKKGPILGQSLLPKALGLDKKTDGAPMGNDVDTQASADARKSGVDALTATISNDLKIPDFMRREQSA